MEITWNLFFWITIISVVAIVAGVVTTVVKKNAETRRYEADARDGGNYKALVEESARVNSALLARLTDVENRLATIEKTLTDIP